MASGGGEGLTGAGKVFVAIIILALLGGGVYLLRDKVLPSGKQPEGTVDIEKLRGTMDVPADLAEQDSAVGITTVSEYTYIPSQKLPEVKGVSAYKWNDADPTVVFPINVWIGWLPIVAANHGFAPNTDSVFYKEHGFKVELKLIDDPVAARDAYAAGESHILWGTLDMMALFAPGLAKDSRTSPRIFQQIDWSCGGDGIVVRDTIKSVADLKGKTVVYAENSPSQYYFNTLLLYGGIQPITVSHKHTASAFEASAAFVQDRNIDACVSWAPDIYNIVEKVSGTKLLSTTADAAKVIADVWAARADFARDHPEAVRGLTEGVFDAMVRLEKDEVFKNQACQWLADGYDFPVDEVKAMLADAHSTNFAENKQFFLNQNNPTNFERTWNRINIVYGELGKIAQPVPFDQVMDFSVIKDLDATGKYASQTDTYTAQFAPSDWQRAEEEPVLKHVIRIHFYPNSADLFELARDQQGNKIQGEYYDPSVDETLERVANLASQFDRSVIRITGHTDDSYRDRAPYDLVKQLSEERAEAVRRALLDRYETFDEDKFLAEGKAWDVPADPARPHDHALNRRVEINVHTLEQQ